MRYALLALVCTLGTFVVALGAVSVLVSVNAARATRWTSRCAPALRARLLLLIRLTPALAAALLAFGTVLWSFVRYEPHDTRESLARTMIVLALLAGSFILHALWHAAAARHDYAALRRRWKASGRRLDAGDAAMPVVAIQDPYPIVAVVGIRHPVLFISESVLDACEAGEVDAMIAHEHAHVRARDNLHRLLLRAAPALLPNGLRTHLDDAWSDAAEQAADATAAGRDVRRAIDVASALVSVARLVPVGGAVPAGISAFYAGGSIEGRVRRLLDPPVERSIPARRVAAAMFTLLTLLVAATLVTAPFVHELLEYLVHVLP